MKCELCGFKWRKPPGAHNCDEVKDARYEALREAAQAVVESRKAIILRTPKIRATIDALAKVLEQGD